MIKITFKDKAGQLNTYMDIVGEHVKLRLQSLKVSIRHIQDDGLSVDDPNFIGFKSTTEQLVGLIVKNVPSNPNPFNQETYETTVQSYFYVVKRLSKKALAAANFFIDFLLAKDCEQLRELLLCRPSKLSAIDVDLTNMLGGKKSMAFKILKIAFDYTKCTDINKAIKKFFRQEKLVDTCPYCNYGDATYKGDENDSAAVANELDHFFDKVTSSLICYSLFNLVPSDKHCNGKMGKGNTKFNDTFFLNPYENGVGKSLSFVPLMKGEAIIGFDIEVLGKKGDKLFDQLMGENGILDSRYKSGNLNVFKVKAKHNSGEVFLEDVNIIALKIRMKVADHFRDLTFFNQMKKDVAYAAHLKWYRFEIMNMFKVTDFNKKQYSKLHRDLHDYIFQTNNEEYNKRIKEFIELNS